MGIHRGLALTFRPSCLYNAARDFGFAPTSFFAYGGRPTTKREP
jgi:hypothetical protein